MKKQVTPLPISTPAASNVVICEHWFSVEQLVNEFGCSDRFILDALRSKELKGAKIGKRWLILKSDAIEWVKTLAAVQ